MYNVHCVCVCVCSADRSSVLGRADWQAAACWSVDCQPGGLPAWLVCLPAGLAA